MIERERTMTFRIERGVLKQYTGHESIVHIPEGVTEIGYRAFYQNNTIQTVILPEGLEKVGIQAFAGCSALYEIVFPESVYMIGHEAFAGTAWLNNQPDGVVYAGSLAWMYKGDVRSIVSVNIRSGTRKLCADLFRNGTALIEVTLPESLQELDDRAFQLCRSLQKIRIPENVHRIGDRVFDECYKLSVQLDCLDVTIGRNCFMDTASVQICHLHPSKVPVNVRDSVILAFAEEYCNASIQDDVFVRQMVQYIQNRRKQYYALAFANWSLMQMMIQERMIPLDDVDEILEKILPEGEADHAAALMRYKQSLLEDVECDSVSDGWDDLTLDWDIPIQTMHTAQLEDLWGIKKNIDGTYTIMRYYGTEYDVLIPAQIGDNVISAVGPYALSPARYGIKHESAESLKQIRTVTISDGITRIGNHAFAGCIHLHSVNMPDSIEQIGRDAFLECPVLSDL